MDKNTNIKFDSFIGIYKNVFSKEECNSVIKLFQKYDENGLTFSRQEEYSDMPHSLKDDISINIRDILELDISPFFIKNFLKRFYESIYPYYNHKYHGLQILNKHIIKNIKIQKTSIGGGYHGWHSEYDGSIDGHNRVLSWILYLNDVPEGGETEFLHQSLRIKPKTGTFVIWPAYFTHLHRGNPPISNEKYIMTGWVEISSSKEIQGPAIIPSNKKTVTNKTIYNE